MSRHLRVAIVDDEPLARARLQRMLSGEDDVEVAGQFGDGARAARALLAHPVDAVFLDIRMPELDGFAMLARLPPERRPLVVFVTACSEHALRAFDTEAVDYLVKPLSPERLRIAVARVRERLPGRERVAAGPLPGSDGPWLQRLAVPDRGRLRVVDVRDIEVALAQGNYVELRLGPRSLLLRDTLNALAARLDPRLFLRVHRSRLVRIDMVEQVESCGAGQYWLRLRNGACLTSGRSYRTRLLQAFGMRGGAGDG
jgi:two-component system, LytTR family, response regulator